MPIFRRTLTNREERKHSANIRYLYAAGLEVDLSSVDMPEQGLDVRIGYTENFLNAIFEDTIWVGLITGVRIVARRPHIRLTQEIWVKFPRGEDVPFELLQMNEQRHYKIGSQRFDEEDGLVINRHLVDSPFPVGRPVEGLLIAHAPKEALLSTYQPGQPVNIAVNFTDTLGEVYTAAADINVNRAKDTEVKAPARRPSSLFETDHPSNHEGPEATTATRLGSVFRDSAAPGADPSDECDV